MIDQLNELKRALIADRKSILSGDFSELAANAATIEAELDSLRTNTQRVSPDTVLLIDDIRSSAERNAKLLTAAMEGALEAREKIQMIRRATSELNTYTPDGDVKDVSLTTRRIEKRA